MTGAAEARSALERLDASARVQGRITIAGLSQTLRDVRDLRQQLNAINGRHIQARVSMPKQSAAWLIASAAVL